MLLMNPFKCFRYPFNQGFVLDRIWRHALPYRPDLFTRAKVITSEIVHARLARNHIFKPLAVFLPQDVDHLTKTLDAFVEGPLTPNTPAVMPDHCISRTFFFARECLEVPQENQ